MCISDPHSRQAFTDKAAEHPSGINIILHILQMGNDRLELSPTPCNGGKAEAGRGDPRPGSQTHSRKTSCFVTDRTSSSSAQEGKTKGLAFFFKGSDC